MAPGGSGGTQEDRIDDTTAKHLLDSIGKIVHDQVKNDAEKYKEALTGQLSFASIFVEETVSSPNPCNLKTEYTELISGSGSSVAAGTDARGDPCGNVSASDKRFSKESGGECDDKKIEGNKNNSEGGACAPYRRLSLCNKNFQKINNYSSKAKHNLLVDVCMAANYEAQSLITYHDQYDSKYPGSDFSMCTMLARSFADIGDIVRGKDLYRGNRKKKQNVIETERENLEKNLKTIFKQIHDDVTKGGKNGEALKTRYQKDGGDFFQLRDDWWALNRDQVWKAITCSDDLNNSAYFHATCDTGKGPSVAQKQCRCDGRNGTNADQVPTYFDYVPQFLRWFEEWSEDFCRKRKHKLQNAIDKCRGMGDDGKKRYCSGNGYDCTKTIRALHIYSMENNCHKCFFACSPFVKWLDIQKKEFEKQKKKYENEITKNHDKTIKIGGTTINNLYVKDFYDELKKKNKNLKSFLELLSKETACQKHPEVEGKKFFDFADEDTGTKFSRTQYCEPCPECGVKCDSNECRAHPVDEDCPSIYEIYTPKPGDKPTPITILKSGEGHDDINKKLDDFCKKSNDNSSLYEEWKCYHDKEGKDKCILQYDEKDKKKKKVKDFYNFFTFWVTHMLDDSMEWKEKLNKCLKIKKTCKNKQCRKNCECYESWVQQKKKEWDAIKKHFDQQTGFGEGAGIGALGHYAILEEFLENEYFDGISDAYADPQHMEKIKKKLEEKKKERVADASKDKTIIDYLLDHELTDAQKCVENNPEKCKQEQDDTSGGRTGKPRSEKGDDSEEEDEDDENEDEEVEGEGEDTNEDTTQETEETQQEEGSPTTTPEDEVNVCETVNNVFTDGTTLKQACPTKYGPKAPTSWKCVSSGDKTATSGGDSAGPSRRVRSADSGNPTGSSGATTGGDKGATTGGLCIPPRRRKLYVGKLETLDTDSTSQNDGKTPSDKLRTAFIQSAAVETFFLWDRYKKIKEKEDIERKEREKGLVVITSSKPDDLDNELKSGDIPEEFKRQMFYTLGDYADIFFGKNDILIKNTNSANAKDEMAKREEKIKDSIQKLFQNGEKNPHGVTTPQTWWEKNAQHIWEGMVCALCYDTKTKEKNDTVKNALFKNDGTLKDTYTYETVTFKGGFDDTDTSAAKKTTDSATTTTTLDKFVSRPFFFRWLEEWADEFCHKQKHKLYIIKKECKVDEGDENKCSGDGFKCTQIVENENGTITGLDCPGCANSCRFYKKWIERKRTEYEKQDKIYKEQKKNCKNESENTERNKDGNGFSTKLQSLHDAGDFLERLKDGPCKTDNDNDNRENEKTLFKDIEETFKHTEYCDPCSQFTVKCNGHVCSGGGTKVECNGRNRVTTTITANHIGNGRNSAEELDMRVSDDSKSGSGFDGLGECKEAHIFKGIRKDVWTCEKVCGLDVCGLKSDNEKNNEQIILVKTLLQRWVDYFLDDYKKIKHKISHCTKTHQGSKCISGCEEKCKCVEQWIAKKREEWGKIKKRYLQQYENTDSADSFTVKTFLEEFLSQREVNNAIRRFTDLNQLQDSKGCCVKTNSTNGIQDAIDCMLNKLTEKIKTESCPTPTSVESQTGDANLLSGENQANCGEYTPVGDDDDPLEETEENPENMRPNICPPTPEPPEEKTDGNCEEATATPPAPAGPAAGGERQKPEESASGTPGPPPSTPAVPPAAPRPRPRPQPQPPPQIVDKTPALVTSTLAWSVGIGFATFTYFYLKVLYIYVYMWIYMRFVYMYLWGVFGYIYIYLCICVSVYVFSVYVCVGMIGYIFVYMYVFYIYILYICIYIDKEKNEKNEKKKNEI